jgi:hypothetical protein
MNDKYAKHPSVRSVHVQFFIMFEELWLGTCPSRKEVYDKWLGSRASTPEEKEEEAKLAEQLHAEQPGTTVFMRVPVRELRRRVIVVPAGAVILPPRVKEQKIIDGTPLETWRDMTATELAALQPEDKMVLTSINYQWIGYLKEAAKQMGKVTGAVSGNVSAFLQRIRGGMFVPQRFLIPSIPSGTVTGINQRSLRAQTSMGERIALASSETLPIGTTLTVEIELLNHDLLPWLVELMWFGRYKGTGQWRTGGNGLFVIENILVDGKEYTMEQWGKDLKVFSARNKKSKKDDEEVAPLASAIAEATVDASIKPAAVPAAKTARQVHAVS